MTVRHEDAVLDRAAAAVLLSLAVLEAAFGPVSSPRWQQLLCAVAWTVPLAWRRRWPVVVLATVMVAGGALLELVNPEGGLISFVLAGVLAAFTVGRYVVGPATLWGPVLAVGAWWAYYAATGGALSDYEFTALIYGGAFLVGYVMRHRDNRIDQLTGVAEQLSADVAERERVAVAQERARIARELHDIVSHSISAVVIHAQAVRRRLDAAEHQRDIDDLRAMETTARHAMAEMRRLLGMLRADGAPDSLAPQPGLAQLDGLLDEVKAAGLDVKLRVDGERAPLPPGVDLAAYRIIQEALTNVMRHAPGAATAVRVAFGNEHVSVRIENDAPPTPSTSQDDGGHGLIGMRERISLYGGTFRAGPQPGGGFCVEASVPFRAGPD